MFKLYPDSMVIIKYFTMTFIIKYCMDKIKFITKTEESWERGGRFDPLLLEVSTLDNEILFDIGTKDDIDDLKSKCICLSRVDVQRLGWWLLGLGFMPFVE